MFCINCGNQLSDEAKFCPNCGSKVLIAAPETEEVKDEQKVAANEAVNETVSEVVNESVKEEATASSENDNGEKISHINRKIFDTSDTTKTAIQVVSIVFGLSFVGIFMSHFFGGLGTTIGGVSRLLGHPIKGLVQIVNGILRFATGAAAGGMGLVYALVVLRWNKEKTNDFFVTLTSIGVFGIVVKFLACLVSLLINGVAGWSGLSEIVGLVVISLVAFYLVCMAMGVPVKKNIDSTNIKETVTNSIINVYEDAKEEFENAKAHAEAKKEAEAKFAAEQAQDGEAYTSNRPFIPLPTNRRLIKIIVLNIISCGLYSLYFTYKLAEDVNVACDGDGDNTPGLLALIILSTVTCGLYGLYWFYKLGNRLQINARRYGMEFPENGTTVLLWLVVGSFACGIGSLIATHIIIKNTNLICAAYNNYNTQQ